MSAEESARPREERSLGELFGDLAGELSSLVRQEAMLARTEMSEKLGRVGRDAGMLAAGGAVLYAGFLALVGALVLLLALAMPLWVAALLVGLVISAAGGFMVYRGLDRLKGEDLAPHRTLETLKEDVNAAGRPRNRASTPG